jgi:peptidoglycan-associated lipoprotein
MQMRSSYFIVFVFLVAASMTAGCAKQEVIKKDVGIAPPAPTAKHDDTPQSTVTSSKQASKINNTPTTQAPAPVQQTEKESPPTAQLKHDLEKIFFDFDSAGLSESARSTLAKNAEVLTQEPKSKIRIEGNCDDRGSAEYNLALGERRAKAAQQYLVTLGVKPERLSTVSYGKEKPAVQANDESAWAKNRRDEFVLVTP